MLLPAAIWLLWPPEPPFETNMFIQLDPTGVPDGLALSGRLPKGTDVCIRGPKSQVENLANQTLHYALDLSRVTLGVQSLALSGEHLHLPDGVVAVSFDPSFLALRIEHEIRKEVPVAIKLTGKPGSGFRVASAVPKPASLFLRGPQSILEPIDAVLTKPVDLKGAVESFRKEMALDLPEGVGVIDCSAIITAALAIEEQIISKKIAAIPVTGRNALYAFSITPCQIDVTLKGPFGLLNKIERDESIEVYVDLKDLKPGVYVRRATISVPPEMTLADVSPELFTVTIKP